MAIYAISVDDPSTSDQVVEAFLRRHEYTIPVLRGTFDYMGAAGLEEGIPTTLFIDPQGDLVFKEVGSGPHLMQEFNWRLEAMEKPAPAPATAKQQVAAKAK